MNDNPHNGAEADGDRANSEINHQGGLAVYKRVDSLTYVVLSVSNQSLNQ